MSSTERPERRLDPRLYQIAVLTGLLLYGVLSLDFEVHPGRAATILATALFTQWACSRLWRLPRFDPRSPLISALSLCLLLRTDASAPAAAAAALAIASKFLIRARGKHVFNPTNFGLAVMLLLCDGVWVSPGQWGSTAFFGALLACLGGLVIHRAARSDVTYAFLLAYCAILFSRAAWLGDPLAIPLHQLESGALLIFAFFMISDPRTTPDSRPGRILYAVVVAAVASCIRFGLYQPNALIWGLCACAPLVPAIDRLLPARRYLRQAPQRASTSRHPAPQPLPSEAPPDHLDPQGALPCARPS